MARLQRLFAALVFTQAAHSIEEYVFELWNTMPPARFASGLVSSDLSRGFAILNIGIFVFGLWCLFFPVRGAWPSARAIMWGWAFVEIANGIVHPGWSLINGGYTAGTYTAPLLGILGCLLARELRRTRDGLVAKS